MSGHPNLAIIVVPERAPRYDNLEWLNEYSNNELHRAKAELPASIRDKIVIGRHNLNCDGDIRVSRYGVPGTRVGGKKVDGLHLRGSSGRIATTRSMAHIMVQAGLTTPTIVEQVAKNRQIHIKKKSQQGMESQNRSSPWMVSQNRKRQGGPQRSAPRLDTEDNGIQTSNRWAALSVQENY